MGNPVILDNVRHQDLRVIAGHSAAFGDSINQVLVFPTEFMELQREYPIFFRQSEDGSLQSVALLGLDKDENLFLEGNVWQARYVPALQERGPCLIGMQDRPADGPGARTPVIMIDTDHPRVSLTEGDRLFLPQGGNAPRLEHIASALMTIHAGVEASRVMFAAFADAGLIAPVEVDIVLEEGVKYAVPDMFTVSAQALAELKGPELEQLNASGCLAFAFCVVSSMGNVSRLIDLKRRRRAG